MELKEEGSRGGERGGEESREVKRSRVKKKGKKKSLVDQQSCAEQDGHGERIWKVELISCWCMIQSPVIHQGIV